MGAQAPASEGKIRSIYHTNMKFNHLCLGGQAPGSSVISAIAEYE